MSLRRRLILIVLGITATILLVVTALALSSSQQALQQQARENFSINDSGAALELDEHLAGVQTTLETLGADLQAASERYPSTLRAIIEEALRSAGSPLIHRIGLYLPDGVFVVAEVNPAAGLVTRTRVIFATLPQDAWQRRATGGQTAWQQQGQPFMPQDHPFFTGSDTPVISAARAYDGGRLVWADVPLALFNNLAGDLFRRRNISSEITTGYTLLLDQRGQPMLAYNTPEQTTPERLQAAAQSLQGAARGGGTFVLDVQDPLNGEPAFIIRQPMEQNGWQMLSVVPGTALPELSSSIVIQIGLISFMGIVVLALAVNNFIARSITDPLQELGQAAQEIGTGDMRYYIPHQKRYDHIGQLARALDDMKRNLFHSYSELSRWSRTLEERVRQRTVELEMAKQSVQITANELRAVYDESLTVVNEPQLKPILNIFTERILTLLDASYCSVWLLTGSGEHLQLVASSVPAQEEAGITIERHEGMVGRVMESARPLIVDDYENYAGRISIGERNFNRALCVPLMFAGRPIGAVLTGRPGAAQPFDTASQRLLALFANMVSPAVRNAQLLVQRDAAVAEAERANQVKTRFLASVTHELRTPLNLIINNLDFMRVGTFGPVTDDQIGRLNQTIRSAEHLLYLINDLLDVSKIEAGEMQLFIQPADVYRLTEDVLDSAQAFMERIEGKSELVELRADIEEGLPPVPMDARRIRQVISNLLSNAIKFTASGYVLLSVRRQGPEVLFLVQDTGMGIPEDEHALLFEAFERTTPARQHNIEGTGLGLPISRYLVQQHGGDIHFSSALGQGSIFSFTLPIERTEEAPREKKRADTGIYAALAVKSD